ncbi:expressed unknown protein [Seminavis robusta]|uniref:Uncharacterized protein n=1 Tax=Seminavis robusta TaxID=568900 RepID=A0A9N8EMI0_9STRA|nr:expressed unknown protein [Seminavis robusta]|eukprot:Sro1465_g274940.1 n/a (405) ;mRNA; f:853-2067
MNNGDTTKPRRWLVDRCDGNEQVMDPDSRPCCPIFYAPLLLKFFPDYLEQNRVMECLGKTGLFSPKNVTARKVVMIIALLSTLIGWAFLIVSDFSISTQYKYIEMAAFNYASISVNVNDNSTLVTNATRISLGLRAAALATSSYEDYVDREEDQRVIGFDEFCGNQHEKETLRDKTVSSLASRIVFANPDNCHQCADASQAMVSSILMSTITYFFTFTTDILRIWPNYDVNCQKVFGAFFAIFSTVMGLRTWFIYRNQCFASFASGWECYDATFERVECGDEYTYDSGKFFFHNPSVAYSVYTNWMIGPGLICLGVATFAKVMDLLCNFVIPTPSITRNRDEQWEYERLVQKQEEAQEVEQEEEVEEHEEAEQEEQKEEVEAEADDEQGNEREHDDGGEAKQDV